MLEKERTYFQQQRTEWLTKFPGRFVLVKNDALIGVFNTPDEALMEGARRFGLESFMVRQVEQDEQDVYIPALTLGILTGKR
jgi:hypothetical protein